jgi:hypothetical protein
MRRSDLELGITHDEVELYGIDALNAILNAQLPARLERREDGKMRR